MSLHFKDLLITTLGVSILSPDTLFIRLAKTDDWTLIFWRSLFFTFGVALFVLFTHHNATLTRAIGIGLPGIAIGIIFSFCSITFVLLVQHTTIANTLIIISTSAVIATLLGWFFCLKKHSLEPGWLFLLLFPQLLSLQSQKRET